MDEYECHNSPKLEHFVTLFDINFIPQGIGLWKSLGKHHDHFILWIIAMDAECEILLKQLQLKDVRVLLIDDYMNEQLRMAKSNRSNVEFFWTVTPFTPTMIFDFDPSVQRITYIDADVFILRDVLGVFVDFECSGASVLLTEHAFSPDHDASKLVGRFCVQFMTFNRHKSRPVLEWWQERCLELCPAIPIDGKFGDQKYLDDFPALFGELIYVHPRRSEFQGPWNSARFPYSEALVFHMQGFRILGIGLFEVGGYPIPRPTLKNVYVEYANDIVRTMSVMANFNYAWPIQRNRIGWSRRVLSISAKWLIRSWRRNRSNIRLRVKISSDLSHQDLNSGVK
jgi:hypothetical protein